MQFILNEKQLKNLNVFLGRVDLRGAEAKLLVELQIIFDLSVLQRKDPAPGPPNNKKGK